jgi:enoyl-CoA hydratase/carnithine racemase
VNRVVPAEELEDAVLALVDTIAETSPLTVGIGKAAFYTQVELDEHGAYEYTKDVMSRNAAAGDAQEGIGAFLDKRTPVWTGR